MVRNPLVLIVAFVLFMAWTQIDMRFPRLFVSPHILYFLLSYTASYF